jgi:putative transposase
MKKRFTEQQIIGFLKEAEAGMPVKELCRKHGFSDASFYTWRAKFGGMEGGLTSRWSGCGLADEHMGSKWCELCQLPGERRS